MVERMKGDGEVSALFEQMGATYPGLLGPLVYERDLYLAWSLTRSKAVNGAQRVRWEQKGSAGTDQGLRPHICDLWESLNRTNLDQRGLMASGRGNGEQELHDFMLLQFETRRT